MFNWNDVSMLPINWLNVAAACAGCCSEHVPLTQALNYVSLRVHHSELCSSGSSILVKKVQVVRWCKLWCGQDSRTPHQQPPVQPPNSWDLEAVVHWVLCPWQWLHICQLTAPPSVICLQFLGNKWYNDLTSLQISSLQIRSRDCRLCAR